VADYIRLLIERSRAMERISPRREEMMLSTAAGGGIVPTA
jgi:hypothetical protein